MPKGARKTLIILDANALIHRSFHALPDLRTPKGELVNAVYGFTSILLKVLREFNPDYIAAAFDVAGPTFRDEEYKEYKAKRIKAPDELYAQIPKIKEVLGAFNISIYEKQGFEADDVIGTIAKLIQRKQAYPKVETIIVSGDLDTLQLVDKYTKVYTMRKGLLDTVVYDEEAVKKRFDGLTPSQMIDYKGLRGDPSDNIPGVTGVGEKTAIQLLLKFGSIDNIYKKLKKSGVALEGIRPKIQEKLVQYKDQALFSRELATIRKDTPIDFNLEDLAWRNFDKSGIERVFSELGFRSLLNRLLIIDNPQPATRNPQPTTQSEAIYDKIEALYKDGIFSKEIYELEKMLVPIINNMEETGIKIDKKYFAELLQEISKDLNCAENGIYKSLGKKLNINSPQQLSEALFTDLKLSTKGLKKTPGGVVSTAAPQLEKLENAHPVIKELLKYRELQKLYSTYIKPLPEMADSKDRIHTSFDSLGTSTGRISSKDPNLQNIPIRGEWGFKIRKGFIAEEGFKFVAFDYSQMELRVAAHVSGDAKMQEFFVEEKDIHAMTAAEVFGINEGEVTSDMRNRAKALNFGVLYGMGVNGFAKSAEISRDDAQIFIDNYFGRFPKILEYLEKTKEFARNNGYVSTIFGRKRYIPEINSSNPGLRSQAERMAINHPIQGTAADIIKKAMVEITNNQQPMTNDIRLLLQIHDELLFEIKDDIIKNIMTPIKNIMENIYTLRAPLRVCVAQGSSWDELKKQ